MPSPELPLQSDDDFLDPDRRPFETVETVPVMRVDIEQDGMEHDTLATLPPNTGFAETQRTNTARLTQPTQIIRRSPPAAMISSPSKATVQVEASSPIPTPAPMRKPSGILASAMMAPAGTVLRRPVAPPQPLPKLQTITIESDDEGPTYKGDSSDDEQHGLPRSDIKTTTFQRKQADTVPESPARGNNLFKNIINNSSYGGQANGVKRSADAMATAYGNSSSFKRPRQTGPSRALPAAQPEPEEDMEVDDISDINMRRKTRRLNSIVTQATVRQCYEALVLKRGDFNDASDYLLDLSEREAKQTNKHVDLTGSDDELMPTPAMQKKYAPIAPRPAPVAAKQQARVPQKTIAEKWSSNQHVRQPQAKKLDVFDTPSPKKSRTLIRGRKNRSSPVPQEEEPSVHIGRQVVLSDSSEEDSGIHSAPEDRSNNFNDRLLKFFNECTVADLVDTAVIKPNHAEHIVSKRPFKSVAAVSKIEAPDLKPTKNKRKAMPMGEKVADKVAEMLESYEAVDFLVRNCEALGRPLAAEMKNWGFKSKSDTGELDIVSVDSQRSCHDSGIGTPVSDDEMRNPGPKNFFKQPAIMNHDFQMKDYQVVGMNWLNLLYKKRLSCILADDMGLGKTYQVIGFLAHLLESGDKGPHLIVVPAATLENWLQEFQRFCPALNVEPYYSTVPGEREEIRLRLEDYRDDISVVVTTYQLAKAKEDFPWLREFGFKCAIFDEGHVLKNANSQVSRKLNRIKCKFRLLLTGTPLQNNLRELISLLAFMMPDIFQQKQDEMEAIFSHNVKALDENHEALLSARRIARARSMLTPFILRRKKHQVLKDLPKKDRRVEYCDLTPEQAEIYGSWLQKALDIRERRERGEETGNESTHILMKLRQAAIHPFLFRRLYQDDQLPKIAKQCTKDDQWRESNPDLIVTELLAYSDMEIHKLCDGRSVLQKFALNNNQWLASGKIQKMLELLRTYISGGHRTLIFSQFTMVLDILELVLEREAIAYFRLDGSTKVSQRQDLIDEFSAEENKTPVFMLSTKAGGAGINLAKANKVIVFDSGFNPQDDIQAENRAHRIGQVKDVEVVRLVSRGTVEEQIYKMGLTKLRLDEEVAGVGGEDEGDEKRKLNEGELTEKEKQRRHVVEEMFFQKLEESPEEVVREAQSPVRERRALAVDIKKEGDATDTDSQKTLKPDPEDSVDRSTPRNTANSGTGATQDFAATGIKTEPSSQRSSSSSNKAGDVDGDGDGDGKDDPSSQDAGKNMASRPKKAARGGSQTGSQSTLKAWAAGGGGKRSPRKGKR